jgi:hypothetical protein
MWAKIILFNGVIIAMGVAVGIVFFSIFTKNKPKKTFKRNQKNSKKTLPYKK